jgi:hypothetical protein
MIGAPVTATDVCHDESVGWQVETLQACVTYSLVHQRGGTDVSEPLDLLNKEEDLAICKANNL